MTQQQQQMQSIQDQHRAQIQALQNVIAETNVTVQSLQRPADTPQGPSPTPTPASETVIINLRRTKVILPDPLKFDGTRSEYEE